MVTKMAWAAALGAVVLVFASARSEATNEEPALPAMPLEEPAPPGAAVASEWTPGELYGTGDPTAAGLASVQSAAEHARIEALTEEPLIPASASAIYGAAGAEALREGAAAMARHELGLPALDTLGVVTDEPGGAP